MTGLIKITLEEAIQLLIDENEQAKVYFTKKNNIKDGFHRATAYGWVFRKGKDGDTIFDVDFYKFIDNTTNITGGN